MFYIFPTEEVQIPTRIPEKIVVALFSGILVNSGILVGICTSFIRSPAIET